MGAQKLRILQVHNYYQIPGGEDIVAESERKLLQEHGHQVYEYHRNNAELKSYTGIRKMLIPFSAVFSVKSYREIRRMIKDNQIDIVHVHNTLMMVSPSVFYAAFHCKVPVVQTLHNFRMLCPAGSFFRNNRVCEECMSGSLLPAIKHRCYRGSRLQSFVSAMILAVHRWLKTYKRSYFICLTDFNWDKLAHLNSGKMVIDPDKVFIKPNFVYADAITPKNEKKPDYYLFVGRLEPLKGIELVVKAFEMLPEEKLVVAGTGPMLEDMQTYVREHEVCNIEFAGYLDKQALDQRYENAKALIVASQCFETFGMTIAEAYAHGVPVIGGDIGNIGNFINEGITGLHFKYDSAGALADTVRKYRSMATDDMKKAARDYYEEKLSPEGNYRMLEEIYQTILSESR